LTILVASALAFAEARSVLTQAVYDRLTSVAQLKEAGMTSWLGTQKTDVALLASNQEFLEHAASLLVHPTLDRANPDYIYLRNYCARLIQLKPDLREILLMTEVGGQVVFSTDPAHEGEYRLKDTFFVEGRRGLYVQNVYPWPVTLLPTLTIATPLTNTTGVSIGVLAAHLNLDRLDQIEQQSEGLGQTGEIYWVDKVSEFVASTHFGRDDFPRGAHSPGIDAAVLDHQNGFGLYLNYAGIPVVGAYRWVAPLDLALVVEIRQSEALAPAYWLGLILLVVGLGLAFLQGGAIYLLARQITRPILAIAQSARRVGEGDLTQSAPVMTQDEIGELAQTFNRMMADLRQSYAAVQESERKARAIFDSAFSLNGLLTPDGTLLDANDTSLDMVDISLADVQGKPFWDTPWWSHSPEMQAQVRAAVQRAAGGALVRFEANHRGANGSLHTIDFSLKPIWDDAGRVSLLIPEGRDITERKQAEEAQVRHAAEFEVLYKTASEIAGETDLSELLNTIAMRVMALLGADGAEMYLYDEKNNDLRVVASAHSNMPVGTILQMGEGLAGRVAQSRQPMIVDDYNTWEHRVKQYDEIPFKAIVEAPMLYRGALIGILAAYEIGGSTRRFNEEDARLLSLLASGVAGMVQNAREVAERTRAEDALRKSHDLLKATFASLSDAVFIIDVETIVVDCNPAVFQIFGYHPDEILGKRTAFLHVDASTVAEFRWQLDTAVQAEGRLENFEFRMKRKDGTIFATEHSVLPLNDGAGQRFGWVSVVRDITERKQAEAEVRRLNEELEQRVQERTAQLEAANKELEAFSYSVSHDLRAPLRAVMGFSSILQKDYAAALPPEAAHLLGSVHTGAYRMGQLIDDLLRFSRLSRQSLRKQRVLSTALVHQALQTLSQEQEGRQVDIQVAELPPCEGDPGLLLQVWLNLLSNALKYTRQRYMARIEVNWLVNDKGETVYYVKDNGVGFDMLYADKLFGVFQRLHNSKEFEGTGVGLALTQSIINRHGGRIWADAQPDQGATFFFTV
jgi:PAS domain S-box-containing protein